MKKSKMMFKLFVSFLLSESINKLLLPSAKIKTTLETLASVLVVILYTHPKVDILIFIINYVYAQLGKRTSTIYSLSMAFQSLSITSDPVTLDDFVNWNVPLYAFSPSLKTAVLVSSLML